MWTVTCICTCVLYLWPNRGSTGLGRWTPLCISKISMLSIGPSLNLNLARCLLFWGCRTPMKPTVAAAVMYGVQHAVSGWSAASGWALMTLSELSSRLVWSVTRTLWRCAWRHVCRRLIEYHAPRLHRDSLGDLFDSANSYVLGNSRLL